jgi:RNA polymerase sigma-70 factor (ECF subfamily)
MAGGERSKKLATPLAEPGPGGGPEAAIPARARLAPPEEEAPGRPMIDDEDRGLTFEALFEKYEKKIYNLILRMINDPVETEDLTQETFVNAYRSFPTFRGDCKIQTWLYQIAYNQCKNRFRQRDRRRTVEGPSLDETIADGDERTRRLEIPDWDQSPQEVLMRKEEYRYVLRAIAQLPPEYRHVITLCDLQHCPYQEIARITGLSLEAVKTRIHRGRLMLRRKLQAYLES